MLATRCLLISGSPGHRSRPLTATHSKGTYNPKPYYLVPLTRQVAGFLVIPCPSGPRVFRSISMCLQSILLLCIFTSAPLSTQFIHYLEVYQILFTHSSISKIYMNHDSLLLFFFFSHPYYSYIHIIYLARSRSRT